VTRIFSLATRSKDLSLGLRSPERVRGGRKLPGAIPWPVDPGKALELYLSSPPLYAVGNLVAGALSGAGVDFLATEEGAYEAAKEVFGSITWMWGGVRVPWGEWVRVAIHSLEGTGNAFAEVVKDPPAVNLLYPSYTTMRWENGTPVLEYAPPHGDRFALLPIDRKGGDEVGYVHVGYRTPYSSVYGLPPWIAARESVELDIAHRRYLTSFMRGHATPRFIIHIKPSSPDADVGTEEAAELAARIMAHMEERREGLTGASLIVAYPGTLDVKVEPLGGVGQDPTYAALSKNVLYEILMVRGVSLLHLGITEGGYRATASEQARALVQNLLSPAARLLAGLVEPLLPEGVALELAIDDRDTILSLVDAATRAAGVPVLTVDEARNLLGYEPLGDDRRYLPANMIEAGNE